MWHAHIRTYIWKGKPHNTLSRNRNGLDLCEGGENIGNSLLYLSFYIIHTLQYLTKQNTDLSKENVIPFLLWNIRFPEICISLFLGFLSRHLSFKSCQIYFISITVFKYILYVRVTIWYIKKKWKEVVFWTRH